MTQTTIRFSLLLLSFGMALAQDTIATIQEAREAALSGLRGLTADVEGPSSMDRADGSAMWSSLTRDSAQWPLVEGHGPVGTVSAKQLRHQPPRAARQAFEKAAKLARNKKTQEAANELERAIALDAEFPQAHCDLGAAYTVLGRYPEAEVEFRRAIELIPESSVPHYNLALLLLDTGRYGEAETNVRRAIQLSPDTAKAHMLLGEMLVAASITRREGLSHLHYAARTIPEAQRMLEVLREQEQLNGPWKMASPNQ